MGPAAVGVRGYVHVAQDDLAVVNRGETVDEGGSAQPEGLDLRTGEHDAGLIHVDDLVIVPSLAVRSDHRAPGLTIAGRRLYDGHAHNRTYRRNVANAVSADSTTPTMKPEPQATSTSLKTRLAMTPRFVVPAKTPPRTTCLPTQIIQLAPKLPNSLSITI